MLQSPQSGSIIRAQAKLLESSLAKGDTKQSLEELGRSRAAVGEKLRDQEVNRLLLEYRSEIERLKRTISEHEETIAELRRQLGGYNRDFFDMSGDLSSEDKPSLLRRIFGLTTRVRSLEEELSSARQCAALSPSPPSSSSSLSYLSLYQESEQENERLKEVIQSLEDSLSNADLNSRLYSLQSEVDSLRSHSVEYQSRIESQSETISGLESLLSQSRQASESSSQRQQSVEGLLLQLDSLRSENHSLRVQLQQERDRRETSLCEDRDFAAWPVKLDSATVAAQAASQKSLSSGSVPRQLDKQRRDYQQLLEDQRRNLSDVVETYRTEFDRNQEELHRMNMKMSRLESDYNVLKLEHDLSKAKCDYLQSQRGLSPRKQSKSKTRRANIGDGATESSPPPTYAVDSSNGADSEEEEEEEIGGSGGGGELSKSSEFARLMEEQSQLFRENQELAERLSEATDRLNGMDQSALQSENQRLQNEVRSLQSSLAVSTLQVQNLRLSRHASDGSAVADASEEDAFDRTLRQRLISSYPSLNVTNPSLSAGQRASEFDSRLLCYLQTLEESLVSLSSLLSSQNPPLSIDAISSPASVLHSLSMYPLEDGRYYVHQPQILDNVLNRRRIVPFTSPCLKLGYPVLSLYDPLSLVCSAPLYSSASSVNSASLLSSAPTVSRLTQSTVSVEDGSQYRHEASELSDLVNRRFLVRFTSPCRKESFPVLSLLDIPGAVLRAAERDAAILQAAEYNNADYRHAATVLSSTAVDVSRLTPFTRRCQSSQYPVLTLVDRLPMSVGVAGSAEDAFAVFPYALLSFLRGAKAGNNSEEDSTHYLYPTPTLRVRRCRREFLPVESVRPLVPASSMRTAHQPAYSSTSAARNISEAPPPLRAHYPAVTEDFSSTLAGPRTALEDAGSASWDAASAVPSSDFDEMFQNLLVACNRLTDSRQESSTAAPAPAESLPAAADSSPSSYTIQYYVKRMDEEMESLRTDVSILSQSELELTEYSSSISRDLLEFVSEILREDAALGNASGFSQKSGPADWSVHPFPPVGEDRLRSFVVSGRAASASASASLDS